VAGTTSSDVFYMKLNDKHEMCSTHTSSLYFVYCVLQLIDTRNYHGNGIPNGNGNFMGIEIRLHLVNENREEWE